MKTKIVIVDMHKNIQIVNIIGISYINSSSFLNIATVELYGPICEHERCSCLAAI